MRDRPVTPATNPSTMNILPRSQPIPMRCLLVLTLALPVSTGFAQQTAAPAPVTATEESYELPPFEVRTEKDEGYLAQNTASGSRLNTSLKDTASPISVFTPEFLADIGATDIAALSEYTVNTERLNGTVGDVANGNEFSGGTLDLRVRGLPSARMVNFFVRNGEVDTYNTERIELSRGPNALLFGLGGAGGAFNTTTKKADLRRVGYSATVRTGDYEAMRASIDLNQPLVPGKAALRFNAVDDFKNSWRPHEGKNNRRYALTGRWQVTPKILLNVEYEKDELDVQLQRKWASFDSYSDWNAAGQNLDPKVAAPGLTLAQTRANLAIATTAANSQFWVWNATDNELVNYGGATAANIQSRSANTIAPVVPFGGTVAGSGPQENPMLLDFSVVPRDVSIGGPGIGNLTDQDNFTTSLTVEPLKDLFFELAYNRQEVTSSSHDIGNTEIRVIWDTSPTTVTGAANPHAKQAFLEILPNQRNANTLSNDLRLTGSYEFDLGKSAGWKKWLGRHRVAALGERRSEDRQSYNSIRKIVVNPPNTTSPEHANNSVRYRTYVDLSGPIDEIAVADFRSDPLGRFAWVPALNIVDTKRVTDTVLVAAQSYFWQDRIVTTFGYRDDQVKDWGSTTTRGAAYGTFTQGNLMAVRNADPESGGGITRTEGVVVHATSWLAGFYNTSSSFNLANQANRIAPGIQAPNAEGVSDDLGLKISLFNGRVYATVTYYETATTRDAGSLNAGISNAGVNAIWDALNTTTLPGQTQTILAAAGINIDDVRANFNAYTFDSASQGWEYEIVANPKPSWRMSFSFADRVSKQTNTATELFAYLDQHRALWTANGTVVTANNAQTVAQVLSNVDADHETRLVRPNGLRRLGDARYSASFRTNYTVREGALRGFGFGAGARWRGETIVGYSATLEPLNVAGYTLVDANLSYRTKASLFKRKIDLSVQLNVNNILDKDDIIPTRLFDNGEIRTYRFQDPRDWFITVTAKF